MTLSHAESEVHLRQGFKPINIKHSIVHLHDDASSRLELDDTGVTKVRFFTDADECSHFIESLGDAKLYLVVSIMVTDEFIMRVGASASVIAIYLYDVNTRSNNNELPKCRTFDNKADLVEKLNTRIKNDTGMVQFEFAVLGGGNTTSTCFDLHSESHLHMWFQLLLENLIRMRADEKHKAEFISYWQNFYQNDPDERKFVEEFTKEYKPEDAIQWYTRHTFIFLQLNAALRQQNIDMLFLFHFYLTDLYNQLKPLHQHFIIDEIKKKEQDELRPILHVYRYQILSNSEMDKLKNQAQPKYISSNIMFSTTRDRDLALEEFTGQPQKGLEYCLFEIELDLKKQTTTMFADITHLSKYKNEKEVLFMAGTLFQVEKMTLEMYGSIKVTHIWLVLCNADVHPHHGLMQSLKNNRLEDEGGLLILAHILKDLGNYSKAGEFYQRFLDETPDYNLLQKAACISGLGNVSKALGHYPNAKSYYQDALNLKRQIFRDDFHPNLAVNFNNMGLVCRHLEQFNEAVGYHKRALAIREKVVKDIQANQDPKQCRRRNVDVADSHCNLATVYSEQNNITLAWVHAEESRSIYERYLEVDDPKIPSVYRLIGLLHQAQGEYNKAKDAFKQALTTQQKVLGEHNVETAATKCCLGYLLWDKSFLEMSHTGSYTDAMVAGHRYCCEGMICFDKFGLPSDHRYRKFAKLVIQQHDSISN